VGNDCSGVETLSHQYCPTAPAVESHAEAIGRPDGRGQ
jgi:hypothetical protein